MSELVSHGRGGTGNIGKDEHQYVDGGIHREGNPSGVYSTGRGGHSNIASPKGGPVLTGNDDDVIPEASKVLTREEPYHGGRGGEGNAVKPGTEKRLSGGMIAKLKEKLYAILGKKKTAAAPATTTAPAATTAAA